MKFLIKIILCALLLSNVLLTQNVSGDDTKLDQSDAYFLLDNLLSLSEKSGNQKTQLAKYKTWAKLHKKFRSDDALTKNEMKIYLFMVFIADEKTKIDPQEEMAKEIEQIFVRQSSMILSILKELPFLIPSNCNSLNNHFDLFSNKEEKQKFITKNRNAIIESLGKEYAKICFDKLRN